MEFPLVILHGWVTGRVSSPVKKRAAHPKMICSRSKDGDTEEELANPVHV